MPTIVLEFVRPPCWQLEISHAYNDEQAWGDCLSLARYIAASCKGVTYTGEAGIDWPENARGQHQRPEEERPIDILTLEWFVSSPRMSSESVRAFLVTLKERFPLAWPRRFGDSEPLQGQLTTYEYKPFLDFWQELHSSNDFFKSILLKAKQPCLGGQMTFPIRSQREANETLDEWRTRKLHPTEDINTIELQFDCGAISKEPAQLEKIVDLFKTASLRLDSFYARGYLNTGIDSQSGIGRMGAYPHRIGHEWTGLPPMPMWLSWFGRSYKELILKSVEKFDPEVSNSGVFVRLAPKPAALRELQDAGFTLPPELLPRASTNSIDIDMEKLLEKLDAATSAWSRPASTWSPPVWERGRAAVIPNLQ